MYRLSQPNPRITGMRVDVRKLIGSVTSSMIVDFLQLFAFSTSEAEVKAKRFGLFPGIKQRKNSKTDRDMIMKQFLVIPDPQGH